MCFTHSPVPNHSPRAPKGKLSRPGGKNIVFVDAARTPFLLSGKLN